MSEETARPRPSLVEFWDGLSATLDLAQIERFAMHVKGSRCPSPLRFLEIHQDLRPRIPERLERTTRALVPFSLTSNGDRDCRLRNHPWGTTQSVFLPRIAGSRLLLGEGIEQPPYCWRDCDPHTLALNFTYNACSIHRILQGLANHNIIPHTLVPTLFDRSCEYLALVYSANGDFVARHINNNICMYLVPKTIEYLLGRDLYDSECQEKHLTAASLLTSLRLAEDYATVDTLSLMALAVGKGVAFIESYVSGRAATDVPLQSIQERFRAYQDARLAIDHRRVMLDLIENASAKESFRLSVILDDTAESVDDLLWIRRLLDDYPFLTVNLIVNRVRVSVNFAADMLDTLFKAPLFVGLAAQLGAQFRVVEVDCPLFALQENCLTDRVLRMLSDSDALYIKGANFFETLQLEALDTFYAFVVHGWVSQKLTGLANGDGVFVRVPPGWTGYECNGGDTTTLSDMLDRIGRDVNGGI